jgi:hypothetical protein
VENYCFMLPQIKQLDTDVEKITFKYRLEL